MNRAKDDYKSVALPAELSRQRFEISYNFGRPSCQ